MASTDRITGNYYLDTLRGPTGTGDMYINLAAGEGNLVVKGNLTVVGSFSKIESVETLFYDNEIVLNGDVVNHYPDEDAGVTIRRGLSANVGLRWNEGIDWWQFTNDGFVWWIMLRMIKDDPNPHLGGHLYTDCFEIRSSDPCNILLTPGYTGTKANTAIQINHVDSAVANIPYVIGSTVFYGSDPGNGNTGLFIVDKDQRKEELITKRRAVLYSLVL